MFFPLSLHLHVQDGIRNFIDADVFSACYLWHKISVVPSQEGVWNPPEPELKLNMVEMHQWKQQSNSIPQISWDIPLHHVKAWKKFCMEKHGKVLHGKISFPTSWVRLKQHRKNLRQLHREMLCVCFIRCGVAEHYMVETQFSLSNP